MNNIGFKINDYFFINALGLLMLKEVYAEREDDLREDTIIRIKLSTHRVLFEQISKKCLFGYFVEDINDTNGLVTTEDLQRFGIPFENKDTIKHIDLTSNGFRFKVYDNSDNNNEYKVFISFDELNNISKLLEDKQGELFSVKVKEVKDLANQISENRIFEVDKDITTPFTTMFVHGFNSEAIYHRYFGQMDKLTYGNMLLITLYEVRELIKEYSKQ